MFTRRFIITQICFITAAVFIFGFYLKEKKFPALPIYNAVEDFKLKNQSGHDVGLANLKGKVWVADFMFTTCSGICPMMTKNMSSLQKGISQYKDVNLVSISVNPESDSPEVLNAYAQKYNAHGDQWLFLTGSRDQIQKLAVQSFKIGDMKEIVFHSSLFVLVDRKGIIRGYYDGTDEERLNALRYDLPRLRWEFYVPLLPTINASLNGLAGVFLLLGFLAIKRRDKVAHRKWMIAAFLSSTLFLCAYLYYHFTTHLLTRYQGQGLWKGVYLFILGTHTPLAVIIVPFIIIAIKHALKGEFDKHKRITRWLYPAWMYVSITGVLVYLMLYVFKAA